MPRFFFDYYEDGDLFIDREGVELADLAAARIEAAEVAADIARDHLAGTPTGTQVEVRVRTAFGDEVCIKSIDIAVDGARLAEDFPESDIRRREPRRPHPGEH